MPSCADVNLHEMLKCTNFVFFESSNLSSDMFSRDGLFIQPSASLSCILSWEPKQCWPAPFFTDQAFIPRTYVLKFPFQLLRMLTFVHQKFPSNPNLIFHKSHSRLRSLNFSKSVDEDILTVYVNEPRQATTKDGQEAFQTSWCTFWDRSKDTNISHGAHHIYI